MKLRGALISSGSNAVLKPSCLAGRLIDSTTTLAATLPTLSHHFNQYLPYQPMPVLPTSDSVVGVAGIADIAFNF